jgi:acetoin utilization deacetylase AcuC-like enzyme
MGLIVIASERFEEHQTPPGHPESPARAAVLDAVAAEWRGRGGEVVAPRDATGEQLRRVHASEYLALLDETAGRAAAFDADTYTSPETIDIARLAAGAAVDAVERVMGGPHRRALALVRPPGHHAERSRAMGFCFYNSVAVAAAHARALGAARVAIVDYDVHHGNGTQHIFEADPTVLYVSVHQFPYYPGTGSAREVGKDEGRGFTVNLPLEAGATDDDYRVAFEDVVLPVTRQFSPDVLLVSAGFDAHVRDPLGGMRLNTGSFGAMTAALRRTADECCGGRIVLVTEGGYDLRALGESIAAAVDALASDEHGDPEWPGGSPASSRGAAGVAAARAAVSAFWNL